MMQQTMVHRSVTLDSPTPRQLQRDLCALTTQQQRTLTELRAVKKRGDMSNQALYKHIRWLEWLLCAAFAMICLLMVTLGMMWRLLT